MDYPNPRAFHFTPSGVRFTMISQNDQNINNSRQQSCSYVIYWFVLLNWLRCFFISMMLYQQLCTIWFTKELRFVKTAQKTNLPPFSKKTLVSTSLSLEETDEPTEPEETGKLPEAACEEVFSLPRFEGSALYPCVALSNHSCSLAADSPLGWAVGRWKMKSLEFYTNWWTSWNTLMHACLFPWWNALVSYWACLIY